MFELNKSRGVTFDGTEYWWKIWRKNDLCFQNMRNLAHFHQSMFGSGVFTGEFVSWKWRMMQNLKTKWLVSLKLTWGFDEFWPEHSKKSKICTLMGYFWPKYIIFELEKVKRSYIWWHWIPKQNFNEKWLVLSENFRLQAEK